MLLSQLQYFVITAEQGSMQRAAKKAFTSQQNISRAINALEKEFEVTLFKRAKNGTTLTSDGEILYEYAKKTIFYANQFKHVASQLSVNQLHSSISGELNIFATSAYTHFIYHFIKDLSLLFPNIKINAEFYEANHLNSMISSAEKNNTIFLTYVKSTSSTIAPELYDHIYAEPESMVFLCSKHSPFYHYTSLNSSSYASIPVVFEQTSSIEPLYYELLKDCGIDFTYKHFVKSTAITNMFFSDGTCLAPALEHTRMAAFQTVGSVEFKQFPVCPQIQLTPVLLLPQATNDPIIQVTSDYLIKRFQSKK